MNNSNDNISGVHGDTVLKFNKPSSQSSGVNCAASHETKLCHWWTDCVVVLVDVFFASDHVLDSAPEMW